MLANDPERQRKLAIIRSNMAQLSPSSRVTMWALWLLLFLRQQRLREPSHQIKLVVRSDSHHID
jgi:hypothetical protein